MTPVPPPHAAPVFVDLTGRRGRKVKMFALAVMLVTGAYLVLLLSAVMGGPTIHAPFLPAPEGFSDSAIGRSQPHAESSAPVGGETRDEGAVPEESSPAPLAKRVPTPKATADSPSGPAYTEAASVALPASPVVQSVRPTAPSSSPTPVASSPTAAGSPTMRPSGNSAAAPGRTVRPTRTAEPRTTPTRP